ncbi:hypothetical protein J4G43_047090 [Bradyrhizobium barranii subsp. barranii]|uniref:Uncharacterized protein n=1 Tax=Bradyrhizobium barranii subsp. barranii TaxID=2823807 RepID=A0A939S9F0_9BRAD|nr:hypothetical protein [Bradyrhizobium barranii]UEM11934.1 hypothetical protein J4G43_047090 [Bradyrhizobium barranii subsp. barranii]
MEFEIPHGAEREYLIIFGVAAVYIGSSPIGEPCIVGATRDLNLTLHAMQRKWLRSEIACAYWVKDRAAAEAIAAEVDSVLPHDQDGRLAVRAEVAAQQIEAVASSWHIPLTNHDAAMARVKSAVRHVQEVIDAANATGELAWFNTAYRAWRLDAKKFGARMSYAEARARLRKVVTKQLITLDLLDCSERLLPDIFPLLGSVGQEPAEKSPTR